MIWFHSHIASEHGKKSESKHIGSRVHALHHYILLLLKANQTSSDQTGHREKKVGQELAGTLGPQGMVAPLKPRN